MQLTESRKDRLVTYAWGVLGYNLLVILWGAWVRISGSGAGCGSHWPDCNGEVLPRDPSSATLIELTHRATSGLSLVFVLGLLAAVFVRFPRRHPARAGAVATTAFLISEALLGAGLVIFGLVENDDSAFRAVMITLHLLNTFSLTAFGALTAFWAAGGGRLLLRRRAAPWLGLALALVLLTSMAGAITALGDTLFPVGERGLLARVSEASSASHFLVRLRSLHPLVAVLSSVYLWALCARWREGEGSARAGRLAWALSALVLAQLFAGGLNVLLAAPGWMQLVHLLLASLLWLSLVLLSAEVLSAPAAAEGARRAAA